MGRGQNSICSQRNQFATVMVGTLVCYVPDLHTTSLVFFLVLFFLLIKRLCWRGGKKKKESERAGARSSPRKSRTFAGGARSIAATFFSSKAMSGGGRAEGIWRGQRSFSRTRTRAIARAHTHTNNLLTQHHPLAFVRSLARSPYTFALVTTRNSTSDESIILLLARSPCLHFRSASGNQQSDVVVVVFSYL
jgi:hypothetical protein